MADVVAMPGVFRPDRESDGSPEIALRGAMDSGLVDVVIVGRAISGEVKVFGSSSNADAAIGLMHRGIQFLAAAPQCHSDGDIEA